MIFSPNRSKLAGFFALMTGSLAFSCVLLQGAGTTPHQAQIYKARDKVLPALIHVQPVSEEFRSGEAERVAVVGSGVIIDDDGTAVTNYHVAGKATRIICMLDDRRRIHAELVGGDPSTDIAVIRLNMEEMEGDSFQPAVLGDSDKLEVGQYVLAMGSPLSLERTVSMGVVSTIDRYMRDTSRLPSGERTGQFNTWIQTDAPVNPGNSGGPLVNMDGEVIGINARAYMFAQNLAFAIPINEVREVVDKILNEGEVKRSYIGVEFQPLQEMEEFFGAAEKPGVLVRTVRPGSPAEKSGIQPGDVILEFDGHRVSAVFKEEIPKVSKLIADTPVNKEIKVALLREGQEVSLDLVTDDLGKIFADNFDCEKWGFTVRDITPQLAIQHKLDNTQGVFVSGVKGGGPAARAKLGRNEVVRSLDQTPVDDLEAFKKMYEDQKEKERVILTVEDRRRGTRLILIKPFEEPEAP